MNYVIELPTQIRIPLDGVRLLLAEDARPHDDGPIFQEGKSRASARALRRLHNRDAAHRVRPQCHAAKVRVGSLVVTSFKIIIQGDHSYVAHVQKRNLCFGVNRRLGTT